MTFFLLLLYGAFMQGTLLDRVAVTVGTQVITESELTEEIRVDSFLNNEKPDFSPKSLRAAADRLIEQKLVRKEMGYGGYPPEPPGEAEAMLEKLKVRAQTVADFDRMLANAGVTLDQLKEHLIWGLTLAHFIDIRFRPAVQVTRRDVERYFREQILPKAPEPKPDLDSMRAQIEKAISAERSDQQLDAWMKDTRARTTVVYRKEVFGSEGSQ